MKATNEKRVLISGASMAGLSTAWWMNSIGYKVTVVEMAGAPRTNGSAIDLKGNTINTVKRMGLFEPFKAARLGVEKIEIKDAGDVTINSVVIKHAGEETSADEIEIERDKFVSVMMSALKNNISFMFNDTIASLSETENGMQVTFKNGAPQTFHLVLGCDGMHSGVRKLWFGHEQEYAHFMGAYFSLTIVRKLLVPQNTMQMYNTPGKSIMLNAYNGKTDIIFCFLSQTEIPYDYRNMEEQKRTIVKQFEEQNWRAAELLEEIQHSDNFYFDKFCQVRMPSWTKGRVALIGDAAYCASPAAGMGASLSLDGAAVLADALEEHNGDFEAAFQTYNKKLRPFIEEVQATAAANVKETFIPATEEAIEKRNAQETPF